MDLTPEWLFLCCSALCSLKLLPKKKKKKQSPDLIHCYIIEGVVSKWHLQKQPASWVSDWKVTWAQVTQIALTELSYTGQNILVF